MARVRVILCSIWGGSGTKITPKRGVFQAFSHLYGCFFCDSAMNDQEEQERGGGRLTAFAKHRYGSVRRMSIDCGIHENSRTFLTEEELRTLLSTPIRDTQARNVFYAGC